MGQQRFETITSEDIDKQKGYKENDEFMDGEDVAMIISTARYNEKTDTYYIEMVEVTDNEYKRMFTNALNMTFKDDSKPGSKLEFKKGQTNLISVSTIHQLSEAMYGVKAWVKPEDIIGGVIGVSFKVGQYTNVKKYYRLTESFQAYSSTDIPQTFTKVE